VNPSFLLSFELSLASFLDDWLALGSSFTAAAEGKAFVDLSFLLSIDLSLALFLDD